MVGVSCRPIKYLDNAKKSNRDMNGGRQANDIWNDNEMNSQHQLETAFVSLSSSRRTDKFSTRVLCSKRISRKYNESLVGCWLKT
jgi:hypothetical protein